MAIRDKGRFTLAARAGAAAAAIALLAPTSAWALDKASTWATSSNPLVATGYGSAASGYGSFKVTRTSTGTVALAYGYNKVRNADNHKAYFAMQAQSNAGSCLSGTSLGFDFLGTGGSYGVSYSCTQPFYNHGGVVQSGHTSSSSWSYSTAKTAVNQNATVMRGLVKECLDVPWRSDPCTGYNYSGADTY